MDSLESTTITFEWVLRGLKNLFESSKGECKSKVNKSVRFGGGRWQVRAMDMHATPYPHKTHLLCKILFYANSGTEGGNFVSLYLSSHWLDGPKRWVREGTYKFNFELRSLGKTQLFNIKEAHNHSFSSKTANWGWAQFARRDHVYYHSTTVKDQDAFLIICTITSSPQLPIQPPSVPAQLVPKDFLERVGALLDDPLYSDVEFVLPRRGKPPRRIYANKKILQRAEYFHAMFSSGFAEASTDNLPILEQSDNDDGSSDETYTIRHFDDSDHEDDNDDDDDHYYDAPSTGRGSELTQNLDVPSEAEAASMRLVEEHSIVSVSRPETGAGFVRFGEQNSLSGPKKMRVVINDFAYSTYKAVLYYLYTDVIVFAPLSSSFISTPSKRNAPFMLASQNPSDGQPTLAEGHKSSQVDSFVAMPRTRKDWIQRWHQAHPHRPAPCSAKAVYRLADKLDLLELKERAYQHIQKALTVDNIPYEVFSPFSAAFGEIRKVQVSFFLERWGDIRSSDGMRNVWQQIRVGRHPGFEEVWPLIAQHLEFNPRSNTSGDVDEAEA
ncbi:hypothetical protein CONPUDRAFT_55867 [Coniophora puteana RWD-64-598 SS2]|uniref:MATH domain-containing protein n=1 Tax=Coniophora puteana (strain RWD-64-598) TaxID=741705 RepID=A0A5M3MPD6_CONPW|nr:uncharacterized protein CONPUDRAFT_55867 [Coniophora puteana RWD-64-598 SS2]EIW80916.1 hypothetical protein CONPUDRAFT_55867 [Coniophora puteana RWD-64-598 SS2]